jgi:hypothetical protein
MIFMMKRMILLLLDACSVKQSFRRDLNSAFMDLAGLVPRSCALQTSTGLYFRNTFPSVESRDKES